MKSNAASLHQLIVAIKIRGSVVSGHQNVQVAVTIEITEGQTAANLGSVEPSADSVCNVNKFSASTIQEELRRLSVAGVAADVADGFVDVAVGDRQVQSAIEIDIEKHAAEAERVAGGRADAGWNGYVVENSWSGGAIQTDHFVVEIGDGDAGLARAIEISDIDTHSGAGFSFARRSGQPS